MSLLVVLAVMAQSYRGHSQGSDLVIRVTPEWVGFAAGAVTCALAEERYLVVFKCAIDGVQTQPKAVDLAPGALFESWGFYSPGAYPGFLAPSGPAEGKDGVSVLVSRKGYVLHWKATARTADGRSIKEEGDF